MGGITTMWGIVLQGHSVREVENCPAGVISFQAAGSLNSKHLSKGYGDILLGGLSRLHGNGPLQLSCFVPGAAVRKNQAPLHKPHVPLLFLIP